jgi:hypothetical protein
MKTDTFSFLALNKFEFGEQIVTQFVLFEWKRLGSIIFFYFHKTDKSQDRFHTHAFNAISFKFFGNYEEHILLDEKTGEFEVCKRKSFFKFFPRDSYHRIAKSNGCLTMLLSGPWKQTWKEYINGEVKHYKWNRKCH